MTVDGVEHGTRSPTAVRSVTPGTHDVRIEKSGYRPWSKRLEIIGTRITDIRNVRLYPLTLEEDILFPRVETVVPSGGEERALVVEQERNARILRIVSLLNPTDPGMRVPERLSGNAVVSALWSPDQSTIFLTLKNGARRRFLTIRSDTGLTTPFNAGEEPLGWVGGVGRTLAIRRAGALMLRTVGGEERVVAEVVRQVAASSYGLAYSIERTDDKGAIQTHLLLMEGTGAPREISSSPMSITADDEIDLSPRGDMLLRRPESAATLLWDRENDRWVAFPVFMERLRWSPDGAKLLWQSSDFDIWAMNLHEERTVLPPLVPELLVRLSQAARNVQWFPDSQHILFLERDILRAIEIDGRDGHRIESLIGTNRGDATATIVSDGTSLVTTAMRDGTPVLLRAFLRTPEDR